MTINQLQTDDQFTANPGGIGAYSPTSHLQHLDELRADAALDRLGRQLLRERRAEARAARQARRDARRATRRTPGRVDGRENPRENRQESGRGKGQRTDSSPHAVNRAGHAAGRG